MCGHGGERDVTVWYLNSNGKRDYATYPVDGYEPETRRVYQFHGCKWHGHTCIKDRTEKQRERYLDTFTIDGLIENNGVDTLTHKISKFNLVRVWECEKSYKKSVKFEKKFRRYPHFIVHDWEAIQKPLNEQPTDDLTYIAKHVPVSVAICDTFSGEPVYLVDKDPEKLVEKFMDALSKKRDAIVKDVETKYPYPSDFVMLPKKVKESWREWVNQVPVVGFNSGKYDMNLIKEYFVKTVSFDEEKDVFAAKIDNGYMFITTSRFKFLDVKNYSGPGLSYDAWCRSMGCKLHKLVFPYEWLDSYEKLNLPCHNIVFQDFFSTLDGGCIMQHTKNAILKCQLFTKEYIQDRQCKAMGDALRVYNLADVEPFAEALKKTAEQYYPDKIDMLKDAVSISGISMTYVLNKALDNDKNLELYAPGGGCDMCKEKKSQLDGCDCDGALKMGAYCTDCQKTLKGRNDCKCDPVETYNLLKTGMVGGPAQVFTRYHEKDVTYIRSHIEREKLCKEIIGYDANALYLYCSGDVMPCGKDKLTVIEKPYEKTQIQTFERNVLEDKFFGFAQVDIEVPHNLKDKFSEMPPLLVVDEIPDNCIPEEIKLYKKLTGRKTIKGTKKLLGVTKAKKILLYSPLLKWYLNHGMVITGVHHLIGYEPGRPFAWFPEEVDNERRQADNDPSKKQLGDVSKLKGNSFYEKMIEDLIRHLSTTFTTDERKVDEALRSPSFADLEEIGGAYEMKKR